MSHRSNDKSYYPILSTNLNQKKYITRQSKISYKIIRSQKRSSCRSKFNHAYLHNYLKKSFSAPFPSIKNTSPAVSRRKSHRNNRSRFEATRINSDWRRAKPGNRFPRGQSIITRWHLACAREEKLPPLPPSKCLGKINFAPAINAYRAEARKRRQRGSKKVLRDVPSGDGPLDRPKNKACNSIETSHRHRGNST